MTARKPETWTGHYTKPVAPRPMNVGVVVPLTSEQRTLAAAMLARHNASDLAPMLGLA